MEEHESNEWVEIETPDNIFNHADRLKHSLDISFGKLIIGTRKITRNKFDEQNQKRL